jgi:shikimate 5-dehydrogenase
MRRMYFIGVATAQSSIHRIFPEWARLAGVESAELTGIDVPLGASSECYRGAVARIRDDPEAVGALVTSHKVGIWEHARGFFTDFDDDARLLGEVSCIVRREARLTGLAIDTLTAGLALRSAAPKWPLKDDVLIFGAGGAALALAVHLERHHSPASLTLTDSSEQRVQKVRGLTHARVVRVAGVAENDDLLGLMPPGSLIVNATGMGKDVPGSPLTGHVRFPGNSIAWDFNYRGDLTFLEQARAQGVRAVNGWDYFLHGWTQILARIYGFSLTPDLFERMRAAAR